MFKQTKWYALTYQLEFAFSIAKLRILNWSPLAVLALLVSLCHRIPSTDGNGGKHFNFTPKQE